MPKLFYMFVFFILCMTTFKPLDAHADGNAEIQPSLELNRPVILNYAQRQQANTWIAYDYFDPSLDFLNYAGKTGTSTKLTKWTAFRGGININLAEEVRLRFSAESGSQKLTRPVEPKELNPKYWGADLRLQWITRLSTSTDISLETGYSKHSSPAYSVTKFQQGNTTITALPGKELFSSSSSDRAWLIGSIASYHASPTLTLHANLEYRDVKVQSTTNSIDPLISATLAAQQIPQATPWKEQHIVAGAGLDWEFLSDTLLSMDLRQYSINRKNYLPRKGFADYNQNTVFDASLSYAINNHFTLYSHGQAASHFVLGQLPLLYNRRNNHTFKNPFGFLSLGVQYKL